MIDPLRDEQPGPAGVTAVLRQDSERLEQAVSAQRRPPDTILRSADPLKEATSAAVSGAGEWIWLLDGSAAPDPDALARLLAVLEAGPLLPPPILLVSKAVDARGDLDLALAPWFRRGQTPVTMLAFSRRVLPVRAASTASLLVSRDAILRADPPRSELDAAAAALEWTGRLLREATGYLVPASVAQVTRDGGSESRGWLSGGIRSDARTAGAMLTSRGWHAKEKIWLLPELIGGSTRGAAERRRGRQKRPA